LNTTDVGTVTVRATITNGVTATTNYTQDFIIEIDYDNLGNSDNPDNPGTTGFVPVTSITGVPTGGAPGTPLTLTGTVNPSNATNRTIVWSVANAGTTGATVSGTTLNTTAAGTVTVRATITNGATATTNYTQNFTITIASNMVSATFNSVTANGSSTQTTTQLTLTFSQAITGLTASDITLSGVSGVVRGSLSGSGPTYTLGISGFTSGGTLTVAVSRSGFNISPSSRTVTIFHSGGGGSTQLTGTVSITGTPQVGQTLSVNTNSLGGSGTISYQWRAGSSNVGTASTLTLTSSHVGANITVIVTRANNSGSVTSSAVGPVTAGVTIPSAPSGVTATAQSSSSILVSWNAVSGATSYRVEVRTTSTGTWSTLTTVTGTSHTHTGLTANTQRWYRVFAINSAGTSSASTIVNATTTQAAFGREEAHAAFLQAGGSSYSSVFPIGSFTWNASSNTLSFTSNPPGSGASGVRGFEATSGSPASMLFFVEMEIVFNASRQITTVRHRYVITWASGITGLNPSNPTSTNPHRTAWASTNVSDGIIVPGHILTRNIGQTTTLPFLSGTWRRTN
jgi:hypothetical protein